MKKKEHRRLPTLVLAFLVGILLIAIFTHPRRPAHEMNKPQVEMPIIPMRTTNDTNNVTKALRHLRAAERELNREGFDSKIIDDLEEMIAFLEDYNNER